MTKDVKTLQFNVEDMGIIEENNDSQFATARILAFSSDRNLHDFTCSEEVLKKTAYTIYNKPILYTIDERLDDFYTHASKAENSLICGFVVPDSAEFVRLYDSRLGLYITAKIWKRYAPKVIQLFQRDSGKKKVSVEMELFEVSPTEDEDITNMDSFAYTGICILGDYVRPASPGANMEILSFADIEKEYIEALTKEFSISEVLSIPKEKSEKEIKKETNMKEKEKMEALEKEKLENSAEEDAKEKEKDAKDKEKEEMSEDKDTEKEKDKEEMSEDKDKEEKDAKDKEEMSEDKDKDKEEEEKDAKDKEEMSENEDKDEDEEDPEEEGDVYSNFQYPENFSLEEISQIFSDDAEEVIKLAKEECLKENADPSIIMRGMFAKLKQVIHALSEIKKENEGLREFKENMENKQKNYEVDQTLMALSEKVVIPDEEREEMLKEAEKYSLDTLTEWKTYCKAKSFEFDIRQNAESESDVVKVGLPFWEKSNQSKDDLWS